MERPILFSTPMVQTILDGRKTQTRRIIKPQPYGSLMPHQLKDDGFFKREHIGKWLWETKTGEYLKFCPYGQIGDILWVRETWQELHGMPNDQDNTTDCGFIYKADIIPAYSKSIKWKPSIFMPKEACRIRLKITNIRVERLQDISEKDAEAEGAESTSIDGGQTIMYKLNYVALWESINGKGSWEKNPWVWVIEFEKF